MTDAPASYWLEQRQSRIDGYDRTWGAFLDMIAAAHADGADMAALLRHYDALAERIDAPVTSSVAGAVAAIDLAGFSACRLPLRLVVRDGGYRMQPHATGADLLVGTVAGLVDADTDCIVEFGSGLGFNLARLRLLLGQRPITYIACEPTSAGREAAAAIFRLPPSGRLETHSFDYVVPDLSVLAPFRRIVAFTCHSIEQIPVLGENFHRALLDTRIAACVHCEPVGWQRFTNLRAKVLSIMGDPAVWHEYRDRYVFTASDGRLAENSAVWTALRGYNTDLLPVIADLAETGALTLRVLAYDVAGDNPFNPSSLIVWSR
jgi:hypothetical protein